MANLIDLITIVKANLGVTEFYRVECSNSLDVPNSSNEDESEWKWICHIALLGAKKSDGSIHNSSSLEYFGDLPQWAKSAIEFYEWFERGSYESYLKS